MAILPHTQITKLAKNYEESQSVDHGFPSFTLDLAVDAYFKFKSYNPDSYSTRDAVEAALVGLKALSKLRNSSLDSLTGEELQSLKTALEGMPSIEKAASEFDVKDADGMRNLATAMINGSSSERIKGVMKALSNGINIPLVESLNKLHSTLTQLTELGVTAELLEKMIEQSKQITK